MMKRRHLPLFAAALALAGAEVLAVPSDFSARTGRDHWEVQLRARAIESGAWVLAAGSCGAGGEGAIPAWGHSMIVDPWGEILDRKMKGPGVVIADLDHARIAEIRESLPALAHRKL